MEPMTLGSAPSSPSSPRVNPNYLPCFLMGDHQPSTPNSALSPQHSSNYSQSIISPVAAGNRRGKLFNPDVPEPLSVMSSSPIDISVDKPGPPKQSLFDTIDIKKSVNTPRFNNSKQHFMESPSLQDLSRSSIHNHGLSDTNRPVYRADSFHNSEAYKNEVSPNLWVTVFGFPTSSANIVLARFVNCGTIIEKRFPSQGNWVHLKFSSPYEIAKALALNGKLISNYVMVGVIPYQTKQANKENADISFYATPVHARSLRHSFASPQNSNTVLPPQNVPQKSTGLVTKAMEYVFGW